MAIVTVINALGVKPERMDEFISSQKEFATSCRLTGLIGGRMYRNREGTKAVLVSQFESVEAQEAIMGSAELRAHLAKLREMVESSSPDFYEEAYTYGAFK
jgi:heme-degrading monooxygenase HmoA